MTPERWQQISLVYQSALGRAPAARAAFVSDACRDDSDLRREVESLLWRDDAHLLVDQPVDVAAAAVIGSAPDLTPGSFIGPYRVTALIGEGGMGQVYRAHDTKLQRDVALKILPESFVHDPDRLARFTREAHVLASLNHPNIGAIYGFEDGPAGAGPHVRALVLELVDGPTLADRIAHGPIPVDEALTIARQIAEALEAAHEHGIVHRDLKPANIKVRDDGTVKVLDFGLAKPNPVAVEADLQVRPGLTQSPTIMSPAMTGMGVILGTAAYMSPEQAKGKPADKRSDIWAFGCVLYEMLTGKRAFDGEDVSDTLAAVLRGEPNWSGLPTSIPPAVRALIKGCLERDRRQRIGDAAAALYVMRSPELLASAPTTESTARRRFVPWIVAAATTVVAAVALGAHYLQPPAVDRSVYRSSILPPANLAGNPSGRVAISPDGRRLAFIAPDARGRLTMWVRPLDGLTAQPLAGTEDAEHPFWSPDSQHLAFISGGALKRIAASGGPVLTLAQAQSIGYGTWNRDDVILFNPPQDGSIYRVHADGGTAAAVTVLDTSAGETSHRYPFFLPDGHHFLYLAYRAARPAALYVGSIDGPDRVRLMGGESNATYAQGFLLFLRGTTLMARPFDASHLTLTGDAQPVAERVGANPQRGGTFSVSQTGTLVYQTVDSNDSHLGLVRRDGTAAAAVDHRGVRYSDIQFSPDGTHGASVLLSASVDQADIWVFDFARNAPLRLTTESAINRSPVWSPDGKRIVFQSNRKSGIFNLYERAGNGAGSDAVVLEDSLEKTPWSWSPDGRYLLYSTGPPTQHDLWVLPFDGDRKPFPYLHTPFNESKAVFSPDGKWVAFRSDESGRPEVYVASFPTPAGKRPVSIGGGRFPRWSRDGRELFFEDRSGRQLLSVAVSSRRDGFTLGPPRRLFGYFNDGGRKHWDVSPDGQRFLVEVEDVENAPSAISPITLVVNWAAGLRK